MTTNDGVTIVFNGGSFSGVLPASCEIAGSVKLIATGTNVSMVFQNGSTLVVDSVVTLDSGYVSIIDSSINGVLTLNDCSCTVTKIKGTGAVNTDNLSVSSNCEISNLSSTGTVDVYGNASGSNWNVKTLNVLGNTNITSLTSENSVTFYGTVSGSFWNVKNLSSQDVVNVVFVGLNGYSDSVFPNNSIINIGKNGEYVAKANKILSSDINTGNYTNVSICFGILNDELNADLEDDKSLSINFHDVSSMYSGLGRKTGISTVISYNYGG